MLGTAQFLREYESTGDVQFVYLLKTWPMFSNEFFFDVWLK